MEDILKKIKDLGGIGIKSSFEDEGQTIENVKYLNMMCASNQLQKYLKIGGCEAKTDIEIGKDSGASAIIAPMIETSYASQKFNKCIINCKRGITIETKMALINILDIIKACSNLNFIVIGRCDLIGSLGINKADINSDTVFEIIREALLNVRKHFPNIKIGLGGAITTEAHSFLKKLHIYNLIDFIETRHVIFPATIIETDYIKFCELSKVFEMEWLKLQIECLKSRSDNQQFRLQYISNRN